MRPVHLQQKATKLTKGQKIFPLFAYVVSPSSHLQPLNRKQIAMKTNSLKPSPSSMFNVRCASSSYPCHAARGPSFPLGFLLSVFCFLLFLGSASAATRYVWQDSPSPGPPYDTWANAAHDIQTAVDAAAAATRSW